MAIVTDPKDLARLKQSGAILATTLRAVAAVVDVGVTTRELDALAEKKIRQAGATPSFLGYEGYPASLCVSVNSEVVHGIPSDRQLQDGDIVGLDLGVIFDGWFTDAAISVPVGKVSPGITELISVTKKALHQAIAAATPDHRIGDIGAAVQATVEPHGYGIVSQLCGHGVGRAVHEPPQIPNLGRIGTGPRIRVGDVLAIEPMITLGHPAVHTAADGWTVLTDDGSAAAHLEHTVVVTDHGPLIVTL